MVVPAEFVYIDARMREKQIKKLWRVRTMKDCHLGCIHRFRHEDVDIQRWDGQDVGQQIDVSDVRYPKQRRLLAMFSIDVCMMHLY